MRIYGDGILGEGDVVGVATLRCRILEHAVQMPGDELVSRIGERHEIVGVEQSSCQPRE